MINALFHHLGGFSSWLQKLSAFEVGMFLMIFWTSATLGSVTLRYRLDGRRDFVSSVLMFGSFVITTGMIALILLAGLSK